MAKRHDEQLMLMEAEDEISELGDAVMVLGNNDVAFKIEGLDEEAAVTTRLIVYLGRFRCPSYLTVPRTRRTQGTRLIE